MLTKVTNVQKEKKKTQKQQHTRKTEKKMMHEWEDKMKILELKTCESSGSSWKAF